MHIYNSFGGYGLQEIIENSLRSFQEVFKQKNHDPIRLWTLIEALLLWLNDEDLIEWTMIDDGERFTETVNLIGNAVLTAIDGLKRRDLFVRASPVRNIPLVLSLLFAWVEPMDDMTEMDEPCGVVDWPSVVIEMARTAEIEISGVYEIDKVLQTYAERPVTAESRNLLSKNPKADAFGFAKTVSDCPVSCGHGEL